MPDPTERSERTFTERPTREEIQARAYELYLERGGGHGQDLEDWSAAEQELTELLTAKTSWMGAQLAADQELRPDSIDDRRATTTKKTPAIPAARSSGA